MYAKGIPDFLKFCLDLELFEKIKKDLVSAHSKKLSFKLVLSFKLKETSFKF